MERSLSTPLVFLLAALAGCAADPAAPEPDPPMDLKATRTDGEMARAVDGQRLAYRTFRPGGTPPAEGWPLVLFLHGAGERGDDLDRLGVHGPPRLVERFEELRSSIVLAPQCPADGWWRAETLGALLDEVEASYPIDPDRVYVTGLSMGGYGTWGLLARYPERFAAAVPICGGGDPARLWPGVAEPGTFQIERLLEARHVPLRVFHGELDQVVPVEESRLLVRALEGVGAGVEFTSYPDLGHDSWTRTYDDPGLWAWLLAKRR